METVNDWTDAPRLKMIERSEFYGDSARVYQYGFYDGFQYRKQEVKELMEQRDEAVETINRVKRLLEPERSIFHTELLIIDEFLNKVKPQ